MKLRGISLPVNTVIILTLAILVLILIVYMIINGTDISPITNQDALNRGCKVYIETSQPPSTIMIGDVTNDGKEDSLLSVCRLLYMNSSMDDEACAGRCRKLFPYSGTGSGGGGTSITCPTGDDARGYCSTSGAGSSCGSNCYCSDSTTCYPLKDDGATCTKSYECESNCCALLLGSSNMICISGGSTSDCQADTRH